MSILAAFTLLSIVRLPTPRAIAARDRGGAIAWYPLVGLVLGAVLALLDSGLRRTSLSSLVIAVLLVAALALLTGFLHLDGLIDTCDAVFVQRTPTERLAIAHDPRAGSFGVVGAVLILGLKIALLTGPLAGRHAAVVLCFPAVARLAMSAAVVILPNAEGGGGMGRAVKEHARPWVLPVAVLTGFVPAFLLLGPVAVAMLAGALCAGAAVAMLAIRRLGGATGDIYGATCECAEAGALLAAALLS